MPCLDPEPTLTAAQALLGAHQRGQDIPQDQVRGLILDDRNEIAAHRERAAPTRTSFVYDLPESCDDGGTIDTRAPAGGAGAQTAQTPTGLHNAGATCYIHSIVQMLYHLHHFRDAILAIEVRHSQPPSPRPSRTAPLGMTKTPTLPVSADLLVSQSRAPPSGPSLGSSLFSTRFTIFFGLRPP